MTVVNTSYTDFTAGELSPKLYGRFDLQTFYSGARHMENFIPQTQGPAEFRAGFQYVAGTKDNLPAFLYRFQYSDEQVYMLEFTAGNVRIYKDRGVVLDSGSPVDVTVPYTFSELFELKFAQNATNLYIVHPNHNPRVITRSNDVNWSISLHAPTGLSPAFSADNYPSAVGIYEQRLIYASSNDLPETIWFSKSDDYDDFTIGTGATDGLMFTVAIGGDVNKIEWILGLDKFLALGGFGDVMKATGSGIDTAIAPDSINIRPSNTFGVADINPVGRRQKIFYMQRNQLTLLSFELNAFSGDYEPVDRNILADHITNSGVTQITYRDGRPDVLMATKTDGELIGATIEKQQESGSAVVTTGWHRYITAGEVVSCITTPRVKNFDDTWICVRRLVNGVDTHHIEYLNDLAEYPNRKDFVLSDDKAADAIIFQRALFESQKGYIHLDSALTFDGSLRGTDAGANLTFGAVSGSGVTVTASASLFTSGDVGSQIWIKSTDGLRYGRAGIVSFVSDTEVTVDILVEFDSVDAYSSYYITTDSLSGLTHLEAETVGVVVDGAVHPSRTVVGGAITLDGEYSVVHVGLPYIGVIESMDLEGGGTTGTTQTKKKNVYKLGLRLLNTAGLEFGSDYYRMENRLLRSALDLMDNPPPLFTGDEALLFEDGGSDGWNREKRVIIRQQLPLPASVQLVVPYMSVANND